MTSHPLKIGLVGDYTPKVAAHRAIGQIFEAFNSERNRSPIAPVWLPTQTIASQADERLKGGAGIWCVPGSPYASLDGALAAIRFARENAIPFLGTCGGFQHAILEFSRSVLGVAEADHAEINPQSSCSVVVPLGRPLVEVQHKIRLVPGSHLREICACDVLLEGYHCRFGVSPAWESRLQEGGLRISARDDQGGIHAVELEGHPFFIATLFQPERAVLRGEIHPLVRAFLQAVQHRAQR